MKDMDIAMFATHGAGGAITARPMSNNRDIEYDGTSRYFTRSTSRVAREIAADSRVTQTFQADGQWLAVEGDAVLVDDRATFAEHYVPDLDRWFEQGIDTPELVMIEARAVRAEAWGRVSGVVAYK